MMNRTFIRRSIALLILVPLIGSVVIFSSALLIVLNGRSGNAQFPADCAIVFGAAVRAIRNEQGSVVGENAGPGIARRVAAAADLWSNKQINQIFLSGGTGEGMGRSEADVMEERAITLGIPASILTKEEQSGSTKENLQNTQNLTKDCYSVVGISDDYHLARIQLLAWQLGYNIQTYPARTQPNVKFQIQSVIREALGLMYYAVIR